MQLTFDKYTITGTAQELADYVFAYEDKQSKVMQDAVITTSNAASGETNNGNPSGL